MRTPRSENWIILNALLYMGIYNVEGFNWVSCEANPLADNKAVWRAWLVGHSVAAVAAVFVGAIYLSNCQSASTTATDREQGKQSNSRSSERQNKRDSDSSRLGGNRRFPIEWRRVSRAPFSIGFIGIRPGAFKK